MKSKQTRSRKGETMDKMAETIDILFEAYLNDSISSEDEEVLFDIMATGDFDEVLASRIEEELMTAIEQCIENQVTNPLLSEASVVPDRQPVPMLVTWRSFRRQYPIIFPQPRRFRSMSCTLLVADRDVFQDSFITIKGYLKRINNNLKLLFNKSLTDSLRRAIQDPCPKGDLKFEIIKYDLVIFSESDYDFLEVSEANNKYWECIKPLDSGVKRNEDYSPIYGRLLTYEEVVANSNFCAYLFQGSHSICTQMTAISSFNKKERDISLLLTHCQTKIQCLLTTEPISNQDLNQIVNKDAQTPHLNNFHQRLLLKRHKFLEADRSNLEEFKQEIL